MTKYTGGSALPERPRKTTKISWEDNAKGTVSAYIDDETREVIRQDGEVNLPYLAKWKEELSRITGEIPSDIIVPDSDNGTKNDVRRACIDWADRPYLYGDDKKDFLINRFGENADGSPAVPISTFNRWLREAGEAGIIEKGQNGRWQSKK